VPGVQRKGRLAVALLAAAVLAALVAFAVERVIGPESCRRTWAQGTSRGGLVLAYGGYGKSSACRQGSGWLWRLSPMRASAPSVTHAALARTSAVHGDIDLRVEVRTARQLRRHHPQPWEVAWVVWHYADDDHFYSLVLKPNGWEIGKEDPAYPGSQRFLTSGDSPDFDVGEWRTVRIQQRGDAITATVDGDRLARIRDTERPYLSGGVAFYTEDATAEFTALRIRRP
jgi:hypothetical protein